MTNRRLACITLDLEPDWVGPGLSESYRVFEDDAAFGELEEVLKRNGVPLSIFVVGKMLDSGMPVRDRFRNLNSEFEVHSYSHDPANPDGMEEIRRAKDAFVRYMGREPIGYRAPLGKISPEGVQNLRREGFLYDASIFPAFRPELGYNQALMPTHPFVHDGAPSLVELPFAVVPGIRLVISMSYLKLFGFSTYRALFKVFGLPEVLVFDSHLYDYFPRIGVRGLNRTDWKRVALMRNGDRTMTLLQQFLDYLRSVGYELVLMSELYRVAAARLGVTR